MENTAADYVAISRITSACSATSVSFSLSACDIASISHAYRSDTRYRNDSVYSPYTRTTDCEGVTQQIIVAISEIEIRNIAVWLRYRSLRKEGRNASNRCV